MMSRKKTPAHQDIAFLLRRFLLCLLLLSFLTVSCVVFRPPSRDLHTGVVPELFSFYEPASPLPDRWWQQFDSASVDELVRKALGGNLTLQQLLARLEQAEMVARQTRSALFPAFNLTGDVSASRRHIDTRMETPVLQTTTKKIDALNTLLRNLSPTETDKPLEAATGALRSAQSSLNALQTLIEEPASGETTVITHAYRFGLATSYEADLWGRLHALNRAARLDLAAATEDTYAAALTLSGQVVSQWFNVLALRQELAVVQRQLELNRQTLELIELRFQKGRATALDVLQQRQIVTQTESAIPLLESNLRTAEQELAVLLGCQATELFYPDEREFPSVCPVPDLGIPAEVLARRPDVRSRGLQLQAADWRVSAARADRLPNFRLTGSATYGSETLDLLFDNWAATLAASLTAPIFDAGKRKAEVARTQAVVSERLAAYRQTVLTAVKEVESALVQEQKQRDYLSALERELDAARAAHEQAFERYKKGLNDYLPVLSSLSQLQNLERRRVQATLLYMNIRVRLALAAGGNWMIEDIAELTKQSVPSARDVAQVEK